MKRTLWILVLCMVVVSAGIITGTYALLETQGTATVDSEIGGWVININDVLVSDNNTESINVNSFIYDESSTVADGVIAPGRSGYFDLILDPTGTDVAILYNITIATEIEYEENISYNVEMLGGSSAISDGDNSFSGVISLDDIDNGDLVTLRVHVNWENDILYDVEDTLLGTEINNKISIPIEVRLTQYLGEELGE